MKECSWTSFQVNASLAWGPSDSTSADGAKSSERQGKKNTDGSQTCKTGRVGSMENDNDNWTREKQRSQEVA